MAEIAAWKIPDIDNVSDAAIEEAWRDWAVIEMGKRYVISSWPGTFQIPMTLERFAWRSFMIARIAYTLLSRSVCPGSIRSCFC